METISRRNLLTAAGVAGVSALGISQSVTAEESPVTISAEISPSSIGYDETVFFDINITGGRLFRLSIRNEDAQLTAQTARGYTHGYNTSDDYCPVPDSEHQPRSRGRWVDSFDRYLAPGSITVRAQVALACEEGEEFTLWPASGRWQDWYEIGTFELRGPHPGELEPKGALVSVEPRSDLHPRHDVVLFSRDDDVDEDVIVSLTRTAEPNDGRTRTLILEPGAEDVQMSFPPQQYGTWEVSVDPGALDGNDIIVIPLS